MKKTWLMALCVALIAVLGIGATVAYLQDSDSDVNVMTLGSVFIKQHEQKRENDADKQSSLIAFKNDVPLYPAVYSGSFIPWAAENEWVVSGDQAWKVVEDNACVVDKFVTVENTGKSAAYLRTIFAFEAGENGEKSHLIHVVCNGDNVTDKTSWSWEWLDGVYTIDGADYEIAVATYNGALAAGDTTIPSLKQVYMDKTATNEDVAAFGESYEIRVLSQAVQTAGFDSAANALNTAFGPVKEKATEWFTGMEPEEEEDEVEKTKITNEAEFRAALTNGGDYILANDVTCSNTGAKTSPDGPYLDVRVASLTLDLNGHTLTSNSYLWVYENSSVTVTDSSTNKTGKWIFNGKRGWYVYGGQLALNGGTHQIEGVDNECSMVHVENNGSLTLGDDCVIEAAGSKIINANNAGAININGAKLTGEAKTNGYSTVLVSNCSKLNISGDSHIEAKKPSDKANEEVNLAGVFAKDTDVNISGTPKFIVPGGQFNYMFQIDIGSKNVTLDAAGLKGSGTYEFMKANFQSTHNLEVKYDDDNWQKSEQGAVITISPKTT